MKILLLAASALLISMNANAGIYGKDTADITCADIKELSDEQLKMLSMGVMIGATAEGVSVSIFSRVGLNSEEDQAYIKGVSYSAFSTLTPELIVKKTKDECKSKANSGKQVVEILVDHIQNSLMSGN